MSGAAAARTAADTVSIALPVFDEIDTLEEIVTHALGALDAVATGEAGEVVIVDDGSTDGSSELADRLAAEHERVRVVHHGRNTGYAEVQRACYRESRHRWVLMLPADGQVDPDVLASLLEAALPAASPPAAMVVGLPDDASDRRRVSGVYHRLVRLLFGRRAWSELGPCVLARRDAVVPLARRTRTPVYMTELAVRLERAGEIVRGHPVRVHRRERGRSSRMSLYLRGGQVLAELLWLRVTTGPASTAVARAPEDASLPVARSLR